ncbi:uncharacterized protein LOC109612213 [Musca domestica]|uniref:Uncharacterized protein LOC109612213 n=1 Tax=Musca domestica TaxID=7370 RepID=A0ABM3V8H7_MUSDO|nr:uncharacterized protein LOC109612213 [Musca domestica]
MLFKFFFIFLVLLYHTQAAKKGLTMQLQNISCTFDKELVKMLECRYVKPARVSLNFQLQRDLHENAELHIRVYATPFRGRKPIEFLNVKTNICQTLSQTMAFPLLKNIMSQLRSTSNFPYSCPVKKDIEFYIKNFNLNTKLVPAYAPQLTFNCSLDFYEHGKLVTTFYIEGANIPK